MDMQEEGTQSLPREDGLSIPDQIRISLLWLSFHTVTDLAAGAGSAFLFHLVCHLTKSVLWSHDT